MSSDRLARIVAASIARHQTRGLVDDAAGLTDVVIHGRVDLRAVADEVLAAALRQSRPARKSWPAWFVVEVEGGREARRRARQREVLTEQLERDRTSAEAALARLRLFELDR